MPRCRPLRDTNRTRRFSENMTISLTGDTFSHAWREGLELSRYPVKRLNSLNRPRANCPIRLRPNIPHLPTGQLGGSPERHCSLTTGRRNTWIPVEVTQNKYKANRSVIPSK